VKMTPAQALRARMKAIKRGTRYHSILLEHEDFIRQLRKEGLTYEKVAAQLLEKKGLTVAISSISAFVRTRARGKGRAAELPDRNKAGQSAASGFPIVQFFDSIYKSGLPAQDILDALAAVMPLVEGGKLTHATGRLDLSAVGVVAGGSSSAATPAPSKSGPDDFAPLKDNF